MTKSLKEDMKKIVWQLVLILVLGIGIGIGYNHFFLDSPLPLFAKYDPHMIELAIAGNAEKSTESSTGNATGKSTGHSKDTSKISFNEIDADTLQSLVESETAVLLDARTAVNFKFGHIPGAISLPISTFEKDYPMVVDRLEEGKTIITYCEGPNCTDSTMLALSLHKKGHLDIFTYKGGIAEWESLGYPITPEGGEGMQDQQHNPDEMAGDTSNDMQNEMHDDMPDKREENEREKGEMD